MQNYTTSPISLNLTQVANSDALLSPLISQLNNFTNILNKPDILIIKGFALMLGMPCFENLYAEPANYISKNAINFSAKLNYYLLARISSLFTDYILNPVQSYGGPTLRNHFFKPINYFTTVGEAPTPLLNLLSLTPHFILFHYSAKKIKNNALDIFHSLSTLSKGVVFGKWTGQINRSNSSENQENHMQLKLLHEYTSGELVLDIMSQSISSVFWGAMAFLTHKGMKEAIEATESVPAQHAFNLLTTTIILSQLLPINKIWNRNKTQAKHSLPFSASGVKSIEVLGNSYTNQYPYTKPQENSKDMKPNYSIPYDPIALEKKRQKIAKKNDSLPTNHSSNINYDYSNRYDPIALEKKRQEIAKKNDNLSSSNSSHINYDFSDWH